MPLISMISSRFRSLVLLKTSSWSEPEGFTEICSLLPPRQLTRLPIGVASKENSERNSKKNFSNDDFPELFVPIKPVNPGLIEIRAGLVSEKQR